MDTMAQIEPYAVQCLRRLKHGEKLTYYKGRFDVDIAACDPKPGDERGYKGAPKYKAQLIAIRDAATKLALLGKIRLSQRQVPVAGKSGSVTITEYVATGIGSG